MTTKLKCPKCRKIIMEAENMDKIKEILGKDKFIQCPHCNFQYQNPFW